MTNSVDRRFYCSCTRYPVAGGVISCCSGGRFQADR